MKKYFNLYVMLGISFFVLFCLLVILLSVDKRVITLSGKEVGLSHLNDLVKYEENKTLDKISDIFFYFSFVSVAFGIGLGIYQLVKGKSIMMVDSSVVTYGIFIVFAVAFWLLFDKAIKVNYRPINGNEASFPSTHIFLTTFFMLSLHNLLTKVFKNNLVKYLSLCVAVFFIVIVTLFRVLSGMHYITDAIAGLFIGLTFYFLSFGIAKIFTNNNEEE